MIGLFLADAFYNCWRYFIPAKRRYDSINTPYSDVFLKDIIADMHELGKKIAVKFCICHEVRYTSVIGSVEFLNNNKKQNTVIALERL
jgi:hypothetical protein